MKTNDSSSIREERDKANISIVGIIIAYVLFKFLFFFDSDWGILSGIIIVLLIVGLCVAHYTRSLRDLNPNWAESMDLFLDFLSPKNPKEALSLLRTYAILFVTILVFSLLGPWFVYESNWTHVFDDSWYSNESGKAYSHRYGLTSVKSVSYDYSDWGVYSTDTQTTSYDIDGLQNRKEVGSKALTLIAVTLSLFSVSAFVCLYFIGKGIASTGPRIRNLREVSHLQDSVVKLTNKLGNLHSRGIDISSFDPILEDISRMHMRSIHVALSSSKPISFFLIIIKSAATISIVIALFTCIQFGGDWAEAMHNESGGEDGYCEVCENVDSFTGWASETQSTSSGYYNFSITWGGGWGRQIILWLGSLSFLGIIYNSFEVSRLSKASLQEVKTLESKTDGFSIPPIKTDKN
jgi:hypothetical protein